MSTSAGAAPPITLLCLNVNGMRDPSKRRTLFASLAARQCDVVVLTETHCASGEEGRTWLQEGAGPGMPWLGQGFWSVGTSQSRGVAVLLGPHLGATSARAAYTGPEGRVLRVEWPRPGGVPMAVVAVYAPVESRDRPAFFGVDGPLSLALRAGAGVTADCFVGGDFNCVMDVADVWGHVGPRGGSRLVGAEDLRVLAAGAGLVDVWQELHPGVRGGEGATHFAPGAAGLSAGRIDMWLAPAQEVAAGWAARCDLVWGALPGDHAAVELRWQAPHRRPQGSDIWQFPTRLLQDAPFVATVRAELAALGASWLPRTPAEVAAPAAARHEALKEHLRCAALAAHRHAARLAARAARASRVQVQAARARVLAAGPTGRPAHRAWCHTVGAMQREARVVAERTHEAASVLWENYGEQSTRWFHRLDTKLQPLPRMESVADASGSVVSVHQPGGTVAVGRALAAHFDGSAHGVFAPGVVDASAQADLLAALDAVVPPALAADSAGPVGDGSITLGCAWAALASAPSGKSPGSDGLPYEVYRVFWDVLGPPMVAAWNEAFSSTATDPCLSPSQRTGVVVLLYKGDDKPVTAVDSYRPITLLNSDYKLLARVLVQRLSPGADAVVDRTQTAFLPGRWIGDNILCHLEEVDYCQAEGLPGCIVFLDFEKAYDRVDRGWLYRCMEAMGFPAVALRWVRLMLQDTRARVAYHGHLSPSFPVLSGMAQGSPLSPLLYTLCAQPLSAFLRKLQREGAIDGVRMPDGSLAPPCHQHADDTSLHTATVGSAVVALERAVGAFQRASNARINLSKTKGMVLGSSVPFHGRHAGLGISFPPPSEPIRHLGILVSHDTEGAARAMHAKRLKAVCAGVRRWARFQLSYLGRLHVAKSVLASALYFHAMFVPPPPALLTSMVRVIDHFVSHGREAEGDAPPLHRHPSALVESQQRASGGLARADVPTHIMALHAKVAAMLVHPGRHPWKTLMHRAFLRMSPRLGTAVLVAQLQPRAAPGRSVRHLAYWRALRALSPRRLVRPEVLPAGLVLCERLERNYQVAPGGQCMLTSIPPALVPFAPTVGGLRQAFAHGALPAVRAATDVLSALPDSWHQHVAPGPQRAPVWYVSACGSWVKSGRSGRLLVVRSDGRLGPLGLSSPPPAVVWEPALVAHCPALGGCAPLVDVPVGRHLSGVQLGRVPLQAYLLGRWGEPCFDPNTWGFGDTPLSHYAVRAGRERFLQLAVRDRGSGEYGSVRPALWEGAVGTGLCAREARLHAAYLSKVAALQRGPRGRLARSGPALPRVGLYHASWMSPSQPRAHPLVRAAAAAAVPGGVGRRDDCVDAVLGVVRVAQGQRPPWQPVFTALWSPGLPRHLQFFGWGLVHGAYTCGAWVVAWLPDGDDALLSECGCGAPGCAALSPPPLETYSHVFLECPVVAPAVAWLRDVWQRLAGERPPVDARVWVVGDHRVWVPARRDLRGLWLHLRLAFLWSVWVLRVRRRQTGSGYDATAVVGLVAREVGRAIRQDWFRVRFDARVLVRAPPNSFHGRDARLSGDAFRRKWCVGAVLAHVSGSALAVHVPCL